MDSAGTARDERAKARDERCAPIARKALAIALEKKASLADLPEAQEIREVTEAVVTEMSLADVTTSDVTWISKLMIQALANAVISTHESEGVDSGKERYEAAAYEILKVIVENPTEIGMLTVEELATANKDISVKLIEKFKELGLNAVEVDYIFGLLTNMATNVGGYANDSVQEAKKRATEKLFNVDDIDAVTIGRIIEVQKS